MTDKFARPLYLAIGHTSPSLAEWNKHVTDAYITLRTHNSTIPDDVLDLFKVILTECAEFSQAKGVFKE